MNKFKLVAPYQPMGDQIEAMSKLCLVQPEQERHLRLQM